MNPKNFQCFDSAAVLHKVERRRFRTFVILPELRLTATVFRSNLFTVLFAPRFQHGRVFVRQKNDTHGLSYSASFLPPPFRTLIFCVRPPRACIMRPKNSRDDSYSK